MAERMYYTADRKLRLYSRRDTATERTTASRLEETRYDALRRRVLLRSQATDTIAAESLSVSFTERSVWDGARLLHEFRTPGSHGAALGTLELDTQEHIVYTVGGLDAPLSLRREGVGTSEGAPANSPYRARQSCLRVRPSCSTKAIFD